MQGPRPLEDGAEESVRAHRPCLRRLVPVRGPCSPALCLPRPGRLVGHLSPEAEACNFLPGRGCHQSPSYSGFSSSGPRVVAALGVSLNLPVRGGHRPQGIRSV